VIILTDFQENFIKSNIGRRQEAGGRGQGAGGRGQEVRKLGSQEVRKAYYIIVFYLHRFQIPIGNFVW